MKLRKIARILILIAVFFLSDVKAYYHLEDEAAVSISTSTYQDLTITTDKTSYAGCNQTPEIKLTLSNPNPYAVTYTLAFNNNDLTYKVDNSTILTYTVSADSNKTHSIQLNGSTSGTNLAITITTNLPYTKSYTKSVILDYTCPVCTFGSWSTSSIETDETATIVLTCTDANAISTSTLNSDSFTISNTNSLSIESITTGGSTTSRTYTVTVLGLDESGTSTIALKDGQVVDSVGNSNTSTTSDSSIEIIADAVPPIITFGTNENTTPSKSQSTTVMVEDTSVITTRKYLWTQTDGASASGGTAFTSGSTITKNNGNGIWYLCIYAADEHGNSANECSGQFVLDNTAPTISSLDPLYVEIGSTTPLLDLISVADAYDSEPTVTTTINGTSYTEVSALTSTSYPLVVTATDDAGNVATKNIELIIYFFLQDKCDTVTTSSDYTGLFKDQTNSARCIYRGGSASTVNNYLRFSDDDAWDWRIIGVESTGTIKIIKETSIGNNYWNNGSETLPNLSSAGIKTILQTYYDGLSDSKKEIITQHTFYTGNIYVSFENAYPTVYLASSSSNSEVNREKATSTTLYAGLVNASDFHKAYRTSSGSGCTASSFIKSCAGNATSNWLWSTAYTYYWTASVYSTARGVVITNASDRQAWGGTAYRGGTHSVPTKPVVFLRNETAFYGSGTQEDPYVPILPTVSSSTCTVTTTDGYETSKTLTINASDTSSIHATEGYSFDNTTWGPTNTKTISAAGTYFGYIKDTNNRTNSCSIKIVARTEYRKRTCTAEYSGWSYVRTDWITNQESLSGCRSKGEAESGGYLEYHVCTYQTASICQAQGYEHGVCFSKAVYKRSCSSTNCGDWGAWGTTSYESGCKTKVQSRTTYAPSS